MKDKSKNRNEETAAQKWAKRERDWSEWC